MTDKDFETLMYRIGELEGERLQEEAERLNNDPNFKVPEELDRKCFDIIAKAFEEKYEED